MNGRITLVRAPQQFDVYHEDAQLGWGTRELSRGVDVIPVKGEHFKVNGSPAIYIKTSAESGNPRAQAFCPTCGTSLYSTTPGDGPQAVYIVRVGMLKQRDQLMPKRQIWWRSARSWVRALDGIAKLEKQS